MIKLRMKIGVLMLFLLSSCLVKEANGQTIYKRPFFEQTAGPAYINADNDTSFSAFTGGFHKPQFNNLDVNLDGIQDLLVFDQEDYQSMVFTGNGDSVNPDFQYAPQYEFSIPKLYAWVRIADFNGDEKPDIFTSNNIGGVLVYKNVSTSSQLQFEVYNDDLMHYDTDIGFFTPLFVSPADIPVVDDIDGDGDLDILSFDSGGGNITFYKNHTVEAYDHKDSFNFFVSTYCWGRFQEADTSNDIVFAPTCYLYKKAKHAGSNMITIDYDNDGDKDLLLSDVAYKSIILLENGWNPNSANGHSRDTMVKAIKNYPVGSNPVDIDLFPSIHYVDVDFDGVKDLVCAPSSHEENFVVYNTWYYKNKGGNNSPDFELVKKDFIQDKTIETGEYSRTALNDIDGDGDLDLVVASPTPYTNFEYDKAYSRLFYYENVGDSSEPIFTLKDDDFLGIVEQKFVNVIPAFGDIDNNGTVDLVLGLDNGKLAFYSNSNKPKQNSAFTFVTDSFLNIRVRAAAAPCIYDVDGDGDQDVLMGDIVGKVAFFEYDNTASTYQRITEDFMDVNVGLPTVGFSVPKMGDVDGDGFEDLVVSDNLGYLHMFRSLNVENNSHGETINDLILLPESNYGTKKDFGSLLAFDMANLDGDTIMDIIMGGKRGGVVFLKGTEIIYDGILEQAKNELLKLYPNPAKSHVNIIWPSSFINEGQLIITDMRGSEVYANSIENGSAIDLANFSSGVYAIMLRLNQDDIFVQKLYVE